MRKLFGLLLLIAFGITTYSQQISADTTKNREYYLQKAKSQKTTAIVLISVGGAALFVGALTEYQHIYDNKISAGPAVLMIGGALCMLGSIPFFHSYHISKQKAAQLSVGPKMEENGKMIQIYAGRYQPAVSLKINLK